MKQFFFQILDQQAVLIMTPEKRNQQRVIYDHPEFLPRGNFQTNM